MNKTVTRNTTYISLLENTLTELFSPSSKKALLNYKELNLIDVDQLKIIDFDQLKLLDMKEFHLVNVAVLSVFFQYIGALFLTMSLGFIVAFSAFTLHNTINTTVLAEKIPGVATNKVVTQEKAELVKLERRVSNRGTASSFAVLIDSAPVEIEKTSVPVETESAQVLGTTSRTIADNACSFRVVEGEKSLRFSSGSKYSPAKVFKLCVDSNTEASAFDWNIGSGESANTSDCVTSYELSGVENVSATLLDSDGNNSGSCSLSLVTEVLVAQIR